MLTDIDTQPKAARLVSLGSRAQDKNTEANLAHHDTRTSKIWTFLLQQPVVIMTVLKGLVSLE